MSRDIVMLMLSDEEAIEAAGGSFAFMRHGDLVNYCGLVFYRTWQQFEESFFACEGYNGPLHTEFREAFNRGEGRHYLNDLEPSMRFFKD